MFARLRRAHEAGSILDPIGALLAQDLRFYFRAIRRRAGGAISSSCDGWQRFGVADGMRSSVIQDTHSCVCIDRAVVGMKEVGRAQMVVPGSFGFSW